ncbi:MAG: type I-E CRISPR-associated endonuclease Cas1 [Deltaproteobacteria bacterium]|nr:type I-E CRISPR-associated endonuclease Cas1 [Deltaproteobacteria bacterium]
MPFFKGRLGLDTARVPQGDRHGVLWLSRGNLVVVSGTLRFITAGDGELAAGDYALPFQTVSCFVLQPGTTVSHDVFRLCARHGTGIVVAGTEGVRLYASMPFGPDASARAREQVRHWSDAHLKTLVARRMYAWRLGEVLPDADLTVLRGIEGARMKEVYKRQAESFGIRWGGRRYDRKDPERTDEVNQAVNHASVAMYGLAQVAVAVSGTIPQLGFIHEDSGIAFALDVADLFRDKVTLPVAFGALKNQRHDEPLERAVRRLAGKTFTREQVVAKMIDRIKELFGDDDGGGDEKRARPVPGLPGVGDVRGDPGGVHGPEPGPGGEGEDLDGAGGLVRRDGDDGHGGGDDVA